MSKQKNGMLLRGAIYHARINVPADIRHLLEGKKILTKSLKTGNKLLANELASTQIGEWKALFRQLREQINQDKANQPDWKDPLSDIGKDIREIRDKLVSEYSRWKDDLIEVDVPNVGNMPFPLPPHEINNRLIRAIESLSTDNLLKLDFVSWLIELDLSQYQDESDFFRDLEDQVVEVITERIKQKHSLDIKEEKQAASILSDPDSHKRKSHITSAMIDKWGDHLATQKDNIKTRSSYISNVKRLSTWLNVEGKPLNFDSVDLFLKSVSNKRNTLNGYLAACKNFWNWATKYDQRFRALFTDKPNPFLNHDLPKTTASRAENYIAFTVEEVEQLFNEAMNKRDTNLAYLIVFGAYTGARIEEIGRISKDTTVFENEIPSYFKILEAKTKAGIREVPIPTGLIPLYTHLLEQSALNEGFLFAGKKNKNGERLNALGKRFGRLKERLGFSTLHAFHSFRGTAITQMHQAGVPYKEVIVYIVGHSQDNITLGVYSSGPSMKQKRDAIEKLKFNFAQIKSFS